MREMPSKYDHNQVEKAWRERWDRSGIHSWDPTRPREETFVVDSPPPTVSGSLHVGHVFSYTHQDLLVRYRRMLGLNIAYPMGWDDNGLPTERRVQNIFHIRCNPHLPYKPDWKPRRDHGPKDPVEEVSRRNFIEACGIVTEEDEAAFLALWKHLGLSIDWNRQYATVDAHCRRVSQYSFLDLVKKGYVYNVEAPTMWDLDFQTAVAQAEVEDRTRPGAFHDLHFGVEGGGEFVISTTRPELLAACIAVVAHPDDERYKPLFGKRAITPIFHAPVPILPGEHADPEKGTGILMVCTFGDLNDVEFWKHSGLPLKQVIGLDGRLLPVEHGVAPFETLDAAKATANYAQLAGLHINQARRKMVELLTQEGSSVDGQGRAMPEDPKPLEHAVKFYERGERPLEFVPTRQWFIRILEHRDALLAQGAKIQWHPESMRSRYDNWVLGLNQDWCISRQRYFGVAFPVWYPVRADGQPDYTRPIFATPESLPVDPLSDVPPGYDESQRNQPGGFMGEPDVMDTWATSSMTPQIASGWPDNMDQHGKMFPMDIRPQSHEIIRTWAFYTIVKAWMHEGEIPWKNVIISGWILDPDRKKMSKSKGNVVTPDALLDQFSSDAVRYWAARARLGVDTKFEENVFKVGHRLATKIFNAARFVLGQVDRAGVDLNSLPADLITEPLDQALVARLRKVVAMSRDAYEKFDYATSLQVAEEGFWGFCDDYLELVKRRAYDENDTPGRRSAHATLRLALSVFLRLMAPAIPFITEEVWSWRLAGSDADAPDYKSIHRSPWPSVDEMACVPEPAQGDVYGAAVELLRKIRMAKTEGKRNLRWPVVSLEVTGTRAECDALAPVLGDVLEAGAVVPSGVKVVEGTPSERERFDVVAVLGEEPAPAPAPVNA